MEGSRYKSKIELENIAGGTYIEGSEGLRIPANITPSQSVCYFNFKINYFNIKVCKIVLI